MKNGSRHVLYASLNQIKSPLNIFVDHCRFGIFKELFQYLNQDILCCMTARYSMELQLLQDIFDFLSFETKKIFFYYHSMKHSLLQGIKEIQ